MATDFSPFAARATESKKVSLLLVSFDGSVIRVTN
jgi:hypothetical protein